MKSNLAYFLFYPAAKGFPKLGLQRSNQAWVLIFLFPTEKNTTDCKRRKKKRTFNCFFFFLQKEEKLKYCSYFPLSSSISNCYDGSWSLQVFPSHLSMNTYNCRLQFCLSQTARTIPGLLYQTALLRRPSELKALRSQGHTPAKLG